MKLITNKFYLNKFLFYFAFVIMLPLCTNAMEMDEYTMPYEEPVKTGNTIRPQYKMKRNKKASLSEKEIMRNEVFKFLISLQKKDHIEQIVIEELERPENQKLKTIAHELKKSRDLKCCRRDNALKECLRLGGLAIDSLKNYQKSLDPSNKLYDVTSELKAIVMYHMGYAYVASDKYNDARACYNAALTSKILESRSKTILKNNIEKHFQITLLNENSTTKKRKHKSDENYNTHNLLEDESVNEICDIWKMEKKSKSDYEQRVRKSFEIFVALTLKDDPTAEITYI